jgi:methylase of polypeptide subunit release factors
MTKTSLELDPRVYFGVSHAVRVKDRLRIAIADRAYLPDPEDLQRDWVATVAAPAFKLLRERRGRDACRAFASIGTGSGVDALCAIELLGADLIGVTDLFDEVVAVAAGNIRGNVDPAHPITLLAGAGDLLQPLKESAPRFDVIYENLPNLPLDEDGSLETGRTSAAFIQKRDEAMPGFVKDWMLVLHYLALIQSTDFLKPGGAVVSTIGARMPLSILSEMGEAAGYTSSLLTFSWKAQTDAADLLPSYAKWQQQGLGPFYFYPASLLSEAFASISLEQAGRDAFAIEKDLSPRRLGANAAWDAFRGGERIGHTVAVLHSSLRGDHGPA